MDEWLFQRDKSQRDRHPVCKAEREGRWKLLQDAQVGYRNERDAKELALASPANAAHDADAPFRQIE
jgi:hypothetical protein